jgi:hypothetical protein
MFSFITGVVKDANDKCLKVAFEVFSDRSTRDVTAIPAPLIRKVTQFGRVDL